MAPWAAVLTGALAGTAFIGGRALLEKIQGDDIHLSHSNNNYFEY